MLSGNASNREPLLGGVDTTPTRLSRAEKIELATQCAITIFFQSLGTYYTLSDEELFKQDIALVYLASAIYSVINSGISISSLYQLGPYLFNTKQLEQNIILGKKHAKEITQHEKYLRQVITELEHAIHDKYPQHNDFHPPLIRNPAPNLKKLKEKINWHKTSENFIFGIFEFISNTFNGISAGLNLNQIINLSSEQLLPFLIAPSVLGLGNAALNLLLFEVIRREIFFLPSQAMMSHALAFTENVIKSFKTFDEKIIPTLENKIQTLQRIYHLDNHPIIPLEAKLNSTALIQINIHAALEHTEEFNPPQGNTCASFSLAALSLFPMLLSDLSVIFATISEAESKEKNIFLYVSLTLVTLLQLMAFMWRKNHYQNNEGIQVLENSIEYSKSQPQEKLAIIKKNYALDHRRINRLLLESKNNFNAKHPTGESKQTPDSPSIELRIKPS